MALADTITVRQMAEGVGTERVSDWVEVTQAMIDKFADATGDHQFIHVNPELAAKTPFGGTIAHGFLSLSLMPMLAARAGAPKIEGARMGVNYGATRCASSRPCAPGSACAGVSHC